MRNFSSDSSDRPRWHLLPPEPPQPTFRRSSIFIIAVLALLTLGLLVIGFIPTPLCSIANHGTAQPVHHSSSYRRSL